MIKFKVSFILIVSILIQMSVYADFSSEEWNPAETSEIYIQAQSAMDLSFLNDAPAGKHGFVKIDSDGDYYFESKPEEKIKFYGPNLVANAIVDINKQQAEVIAQRFYRAGYNVVRLHCADSITSYVQGIFEKPVSSQVNIVEEKLDNLEYLISRLKEYGIYVTLDIASYIPLDGIESLNGYGLSAGGLAIFFPDAMNAVKSMAEKWLCHVNPYTGLALKDDPVLVGISPWNESIIYNMNITEQKMKDYIIEDFNSVLASKGKEAITEMPDSFYSVSSAVADDLIQYYTDKTLGAYNELKSYIKNDIGAKAPVGGLNMLNNAKQDYWRQNADVFETHIYNGILNGKNGESFSYKPYKIPRLSSFFDDDTKTAYESAGGSLSNYYQNYIPGLAVNQPYRKPYMISEYNQEFPTEGRENTGIMTAAVGAYNGWDMLNRYCWGAFMKYIMNESICGGDGGGATFTVANDPIAVMSEIQGNLVFRNSHITEPSPKFVILRDESWLDTNDNAIYTASRETYLLYLTHLFKTVTVYGDNPNRTSVYRVTFDMTEIDAENLPEENLISGLYNGMSLESAANIFINSLEDGELKTRMSEELQNGRLVSDTGELIFDLNSNTYLISTPYTAGGTGNLENGINSDSYSLSVSGDVGSFLASSVDGNPIKNSDRILITMTTDAAATGEERTFDSESGTAVYKRGTLPTLIKKASAVYTVCTDYSPETYKAYKLDLKGRRAEEIPVESDNGSLKLTLETDKGFAFEIVRESFLRIPSISLENNDGLWSVTGKTDPNSKTTLSITDENGVLAYIDITKSDSDGNYSFQLSLPALGNYTVKVGGDNIILPSGSELKNGFYVDELEISLSADEDEKTVVSASARIVNGTDTQKSAYVIIASYDNGRLDDVVYKEEQAIIAGETRVSTVDYRTEKNNLRYRAFVWADFDSVLPIGKSEYAGGVV